MRRAASRIVMLAIVALSGAACAHAVPGTTSPPGIAVDEAILKVTVGLPFDEVESIVRTELQVRNLNIIGTLDIQRALEGRDVEFGKFKVIQFCNLQDGLALFREHPDYGVFIPCSFLLYERDGRTVVAGRRPTAIARGLPGHAPSAQAAAVADRIEMLMREVLGSVVEEAQAQGK